VSNRSKADPYSITSSARSTNDFGDGQSERLGGGQVDDEIELSGLLDRNVGRLRTA
jgi:hypothetical protein